MRHCSPETITHDLIPKDDAVWKIAKKRRQFAPLEMQWIRTYVGSLLAVKIISPVDTGMVYNDKKGQKIPIQQISYATLAPKGKGNFCLCINYVYLNHQLHRHVWEMGNLEECVRRQAGNLRFSGIDGFSSFFAVSMGKNKHLTAFVIVGWGIFVWNFLLFGLQDGPNTYSRLIWKAFAQYVGNFQVYLDNIDFADGKSLVHWKDGHASYKKWTETEAIDAQLDRLEFCVFPQFEACNMSVNPTKSPLLAKRKKTLGHVISHAGMSKSPETVSKFKSILREPVTKPEQLERNLACLRYMSRYLPDLAMQTKFISDKLRGWKTYVDAPLGRVLPKGCKKIQVEKEGYEFHWTNTDQDRFMQLSDELDKEITLQSLSEMLPIVMMMDASPWAISCVIGQLGQNEGIQSLPNDKVGNPTKNDRKTENREKVYREARPVMFLSKVLDDTQSRWSQPE
jgi:hypothetical protein